MDLKGLIFSLFKPAAPSGSVNLPAQVDINGPNVTVSVSAPIMVGSGTGHAAGLVPDPGATAGSTKFLREDGTFAVPAGGGGGGSPTTTKGDLAGYDTASARVPVGPDGDVLIADSTQALGVKWGSLPSSVNNETPSGTPNGTLTTFTLAGSPNPSSSLQLYENGWLLDQGSEYTLSGATITMTVAPTTGTKLRAFYNNPGGAVSGSAGDLFGGYHPVGTKGSYKQEYYSLTNGTTVDLLPLVTGSGYIDYMQLCVPYGCTLTIILDGVTTYSGEVQRFFAAEYADSQPPFTSAWFAVNGNGSGLGLASWFPIPFSTSAKVQLTNTTGSTKTLFWQITYQTGVAPPNLTKKLFAVSGLSSSVAPNAVVTMLNATSLNPGRLAWIYWHYDAFPGSVSPTTGPLEGNFKIYVDGSGTPCFESSGTEDFFGMSNYFAGFGPCEVESSPLVLYSNNATSGDSVLTIRSNQNPPNTFAAFRVFKNDPIGFGNAIKVTLDCGNTSEASFTGNSRIAWCVGYYTS